MKAKYEARKQQDEPAHPRAVGRAGSLKQGQLEARQVGSEFHVSYPREFLSFVVRFRIGSQPGERHKAIPTKCEDISFSGLQVL